MFSRGSTSLDLVFKMLWSKRPKIVHSVQKTSQACCNLSPSESFKAEEKCDSQFIVKGLASTLAHKVTQITKLKSCIEMHLFLYAC
jgi:hypothetical protein